MLNFKTDEELFRTTEYGCKFKTNHKNLHSCQSTKKKIMLNS